MSTGNARQPQARASRTTLPATIGADEPGSGGSLADALEFYTRHIGFSIVWQADQGAGIQRDEVSFTLIENANREWANNASFSIGVSDLDALHRKYVSGPARVGPVEMKQWGRREFHMIVPSGVCLQFYQRDI